MLVQIINKTDLQQFVNIGMSGDASDSISIPARGKVIINLENEKLFIDISKKNRNKLILKKL